MLTHEYMHNVQVNVCMLLSSICIINYTRKAVAMNIIIEVSNVQLTVLNLYMLHNHIHHC